MVEAFLGRQAGIRTWINLHQADADQMSHVEDYSLWWTTPLDSCELECRHIYLNHDGRRSMTKKSGHANSLYISLCAVEPVLHPHPSF